MHGIYQPHEKTTMTKSPAIARKGREYAGVGMPANDRYVSCERAYATFY